MILRKQREKGSAESKESRQSILSTHPLLSILLPLLLLALPSFADVSLKVGSSRDKIFLGETFNLNIEVEGADRDAEAPDLAGMPPSDVQLLGSHSNSRSSITIINGHMSRESFEGRVFTYQIKPAAAGSFATGPIRVKAAGKTYTAPGVTVQSGRASCRERV